MAALVLTAIGDDRAGLVSALADVIADHGGNWEQSQMAELAGKFAGIVLVTVPDGRIDELRSALDPLAGVLDIKVHLGDETSDEPRSLTITLLGNDRPGIVREFSAALAGIGVSIDRLSTTTREAPMAGGVLFEATADIQAPTDLSADDLRVTLEALAGELMVDITLVP